MIDVTAISEATFIFAINYYFMKRITVSAIFLIIGFPNLWAQKKPVQKSKPLSSPTRLLKNLNDSASYAIGISVAKFYQQQGVNKLNTVLITKAINDAFAHKPILLDDAQANTVIMSYLNKLDMVKAKPAIERGEKFLAENKKRSGVKTTASGLQYEIIRQGTGPVPTANDTVLCHYKGTLLDGSEFDNSYSRGEPIKFAVGGVIRGWTEALLLMPVGSKWKLYIPYQLAYGTSDNGPMPGGSMLSFEVELIDIVGKPK